MAWTNSYDADHSPRIHQLETGLWTAMFGESLADLLTGMNLDGLPLPVTHIARAPRSGLS